MPVNLYLLMAPRLCQTFKNPKEPFLSKLRETGPVPGFDENGVKSKRSGGQDEGSKKKKKVDKSVSLNPASNADRQAPVLTHITTPGRHGQIGRWSPATRRGRSIASGPDGS